MDDLFTKEDADRARSSGQFTPDEVNQTILQQKPALQARGFTEPEINEYYGLKPPSNEPMQEFVKGWVGSATGAPSILAGAGGSVETERASVEKTTKEGTEAAKAGWQQSITGLIQSGKLPEFQLPEDAPMSSRVTAMMAQAAGDLPAMVGGAITGAGGGPITAVGGAFAMPAGFRQILIDQYKNGDIDNFDEFWQRATDTTIETLKGEATGLATGAAGAYAPQLAKLPAEIAAMVSVPAALEGKMPKPMDFVDAAVVLGGVKAATGVLPRVQEAFVRYGKTPSDVMKDMQQDPTIKEDLLSDSADGVRAYKIFEEPSKQDVFSKEDAANIENPKPSKEGLYGDVQRKVDSMDEKQQDLRLKMLDKKMDAAIITPKEMLEREALNAIKEPPPSKAEKSVEAAPEEKLVNSTDLESVEKVTPSLEDSIAKVLKQISVDESPTRKYGFAQFYRDFVDELSPLNTATKNLADGAKLKYEEDPYKLARLTRGVNGKAEHFIDYGTFDFKTYKETGPSLREILVPVKENLDKFRTYVASKRALELHGRDIVSGIDHASAVEVVKHLDAKYAKTFSQLVAYQDQTLQYLKDAGLVTEEAFKLMQEANRDYVPFFRVLEEGAEEGAGAGENGVGKGFQVKNPVKGIKGSERRIIDPLESIIKNTYLYISLAERNNVFNALINLSEISPHGAALIKKAKPPVRGTKASESEIAKLLAPYEEQLGIKLDPGELEFFRANTFFPSENQIVGYKEGKRSLYDVDPEIAGVMKSLDTEAANSLVTMLGAPARMLRAGVTLNPEFMARNLVRDQFTAAIFSNFGYRPIIDTFSGIGSLVKKDEAFRDWLKSGGANANFVSLDRSYLQENLKSMLKGKRENISMQKFLGDETSGRVRNEIHNPLQMLRVMSEFSENATRLGAFKRAAGDVRSKEDILRGGFKTREVTTDFARMGAKTRALNQIIAFWNPSVQGMDRTIRAFGDAPLATTAKVLAGITIPSVLLYLANKDDPRYQDLPHWQKDLFWIVLTEDHIYRIPKPFELGLVFGTGAERMTEYILSRDTKAFDGYLAQMGAAAAPGMIPTVAAPFIETWANKNLFTGAPLIPADREKGLPEYQYQPYTTELTKKIGAMLAALPGMKESPIVAPVNIDTFVRDWTGGLGVHLLNAADTGLRLAGKIPNPPKPDDTLADVPFVKAFVVRDPSMSTQPITDFYNAYASNQKALSSIRTLAKEGQADLAMRELGLREGRMLQLGPIHRTMSDISQMIRLVEENPEITSPEKRQLIDKLYVQMNATAKAGLSIVDAMQYDIHNR